jgi:hypothetical protein
VCVGCPDRERIREAFRVLEATPEAEREPRDERERLLLDPATGELFDPAKGGAGGGSGVHPASARRGGMLAR